jgi:hypothetical protein
VRKKRLKPGGPQAFGHLKERASSMNENFEQGWLAVVSIDWPFLSKGSKVEDGLWCGIKDEPDILSQAYREDPGFITNF